MSVPKPGRHSAHAARLQAENARRSKQQYSKSRNYKRNTGAALRNMHRDDTAGKRTEEADAFCNRVEVLESDLGAIDTTEEDLSYLSAPK